MYPGNGISETYNISTAYRNRPVKRCKQRRYTRSKDTEGYIYIYIYMYTHIYIYMYTHVYRCLSVCVCVKIKQYVMFMFCCACDSPHTAFPQRWIDVSDKKQFPYQREISFAWKRNEEHHSHVLPQVYIRPEITDTFLPSSRTSLHTTARLEKQNSTGVWVVLFF